MPLPFCHVFTSGERCYAYDVNSHDVFEIDLPTALVLTEPRDAPLAAVSAGELSDARERVASAQVDQGLFLSHRPHVLAACEACHDVGGYDGDVGQLTLSISEQCNLRCRYCLHGNDLDWVRPHRDVRMTSRTARAAVRDFLHRSRHAPAPSISFYGGEPLLAMDLIREIVALVRRKGPRDDYGFNIDTNGTLLDDETVSFIIDEGLNLQVSLDGPPRVHDRFRRYRGGGPTHEVIMAGLRRLLGASPRAHELLRFQITLMPPGHLEEIAAYFGDFPLYRQFDCDAQPAVGINTADLTGVDLAALGIGGDDFASFAADMDAARARYVEARVAGDVDALDPVLRALFDGDLIAFYHRHRGRLGDAISPGGCCRPGQRRLHVRADGVYQPCERVGDGLAIGDVDRGIDLAAVDDLWRRFMGALAERCLDCWACRLCPLCFTALAEGWRSGQGKTSISAADCEDVRAGLERTLRMYVDLVGRNPRSLDFLETSTVS